MLKARRKLACGETTGKMRNSLFRTAGAVDGRRLRHSCGVHVRNIACPDTSHRANLQRAVGTKSGEPGFPTLGKGFLTLGNHFPTLEEDFLTLGNHFLTLGKGFPTLELDFPTLGEDFLTLGNHFLTLGKGFPTLEPGFPTLEQLGQTPGYGIFLLDLADLFDERYAIDLVKR